jgi:hypothetical protein
MRPARTLRADGRRWHECVPPLRNYLNRRKLAAEIRRRWFAQTAIARNVPSTKRYFIREARKNHFLRVTDMGADEKGGAWSIPRLERLYDVDVSVCSALGKLPIHA